MHRSASLTITSTQPSLILSPVYLPDALSCLSSALTYKFLHILLTSTICCHRVTTSQSCLQHSASIYLRPTPLIWFMCRNHLLSSSLMIWCLFPFWWSVIGNSFRTRSSFALLKIVNYISVHIFALESFQLFLCRWWPLMQSYAYLVHLALGSERISHTLQESNISTFSIRNCK